MDWTWDRGMRYRVIASWGIHIDGVFSGSCYIGCCSHCLHIQDDGFDQFGSSSIEASGILGDKSSLEDSLFGLMEMEWVGGGGDLW